MNTRLVSFLHEGAVSGLDFLSSFNKYSTNSSAGPSTALPPSLRDPAAPTSATPKRWGPPPALPARDEREPLPAQRVARRLRAEGTKRNQAEEGILQAAPDETRLRASSPPRILPPGGPEIRGHGLPLPKKLWGAGAGGRACPNFLKGSNPPFFPPKASTSPIFRDSEGPGSVSARARGWGETLRGRPPIPALWAGEQLQEPEAEGASLAWVKPPRPGPRSGLGVGVTADLQLLRKFSESKERAVKIEKIRKQGAFRMLTI